jgi:von Willebrand factor type A domain-containing protein
MRNTVSLVALGIGLLSPSCSQNRKADLASAPMAERVESATAPSPALRALEAPRGETAVAAAAGSAAADPGGAGAAPAARDDEPRTMPPAPPPGPSFAPRRPAMVSSSPAPGRDAMAARGAVAVPEPAPAANVRAGEWDDNANYRDYLRWVQQSPRGIARLDVSDRQFLVVEDAAGQPVPNCRIAITGGQRTVSLVSTASGRALLFPHAVGLDRGALTAVATCGQAAAQATIHIDGVDGITELKLATERVLPARRTVDLAFVLDTTGSMAEEIEAVKSTIRAVAAKLGSDQTAVRIGLVEYKDRGDAEVTHAYPFSSDLAAFSRSVARITAGGGGDYPEDMQAGLSAALDQLEWRSDATARMLVVIGDAPPHLDYQDERDYADAARRAAARGIKMYTVAASGMDLTGQIVMRQMAQFTGASNLFVLRGGAGPQSVGGGDPQSSCGGTQGQYASGNLDQLILTKVKRELAALDADPLRIAGRGQDENAKPCNQRIVIAN